MSAILRGTLCPAEAGGAAEAGGFGRDCRGCADGRSGSGAEDDVIAAEAGGTGTD